MYAAILHFLHASCHDTMAAQTIGKLPQIRNYASADSVPLRLPAPFTLCPLEHFSQSYFPQCLPQNRYSEPLYGDFQK